MVCRYDTVYMKILTRSLYWEFCQNFQAGIYRALTSRGLASYFSNIWRIQVTFNGHSSGKLPSFFSCQCTNPVTVLGHRTMQLAPSACSTETVLDITEVCVMPNTCDCDSSVHVKVRVSSTQQLLDSVTRHWVEEQQQHNCQGQHSQNFEDGPLVVVPHNVPDWLQWVQEPHEGCIWPAGKHYKIIHMHSHKVIRTKFCGEFWKRE